MSTEQTDWTEHLKHLRDELISSDPKWLCHAAVKSGQILLWSSEKKEENDFKGSKGQVFELLFVDFDPF